MMEDLEQILRKIHVLFANCEAYGEEKENKIIVPKKQVFGLLEQLNLSVSALMDQYEGTKESRERGISEFKRHGEKLMDKAREGAEEVYAASLIYTDNMIDELQDVLNYSKESLWAEYTRMAKRLEDQEEQLLHNQEEIKIQLRAMAQGEKYLRLIERENERQRRIAEAKLARERAMEEEEEPDDEEFDEDYENESEESGETSEETLEESGENAAKDTAAGDEQTQQKAGAGGKNSKKGKGSGKRNSKKSGKKSAPRSSLDLDDEEWLEEERPVRKIGTALYEEVGQSYDAPPKKVSYEVKVNEAYFEQLGEGNVDLDAEYYQWKEAQERGEDGEAATQEAPDGDDSQAEKAEKALEKLRKLTFGKKKKKD